MRRRRVAASPSASSAEEEAAAAEEKAGVSLEAGAVAIGKSADNEETDGWAMLAKKKKVEELKETQEPMGRIRNASSLSDRVSIPFAPTPAPVARGTVRARLLGKSFKKKAVEAEVTPT